MSSASLRAEKAGKERELRKVKDDIDRLLIAKKAIVVQKNEVANQYNQVQKRADCQGVWLGSNYSKYNTLIINSLGSNFRKYIVRVANSIDDIDRKYAELQRREFALGADIRGLEIAITLAEVAEAAAAMAPGL